jgi:hypothetical protein
MAPQATPDDPGNETEAGLAFRQRIFAQSGSRLPQDHVAALTAARPVGPGPVTSIGLLAGKLRQALLDAGSPSYRMIARRSNGMASPATISRMRPRSLTSRCRSLAQVRIFLFSASLAAVLRPRVGRLAGPVTLRGLGFGRPYPAFTRQLRARGLRPHCEPCHPAKGRGVAVIEHPPGDEGYPDYATPGGKRLRGHLLLVTLSRERRAEGCSQCAAGGHDLVREPPAMALVVGQ